ncbi:MAG: lipid A-modifier LpxR family protein [Brevundimonas sp.]|uniref:lipid A-modifier LpxR family protein n=1 Tax=Brevundimonas sp. TaxID=1871086 RepID=UPI0040345DED
MSTPATVAMAQTPSAPMTAEWARAQEMNALAARRAAARAPERNRAQSATTRLNTSGMAAGALSDRAAYPAPVADRDGAAGPTYSAVAIEPEAAFGPALDFRDDARGQRGFEPGGLGAVAVVERRDIWRENGSVSDRVRLTTRGGLRRADGAPVPPTALDAAGFDVASYDVSYTRGWEAARTTTRSGLAVSLTPHAGVGVGDSGGTAEAGATLKIGPDTLAPDGAERFGERARWYVYAAGSGRAVGYNFARTRDGDYARSGMSHDAGSFLGDASVGVAYRRGDMQGSFGVVYREIKAEGLRGGEGFDRDVTEGLVAFQLSIKPRR